MIKRILVFFIGFCIGFLFFIIYYYFINNNDVLNKIKRLEVENEKLIQDILLYKQDCPEIQFFNKIFIDLKKENENCQNLLKKNLQEYTNFVSNQSKSIEENAILINENYNLKLEIKCLRDVGVFGKIRGFLGKGGNNECKEFITEFKGR